MIGVWDVDSTENFDEYMKALGVGMVMRKMGNSVNPQVTITKDGDKFTVKAASTFKSTEFSFEMGQEFDETTADGRKVKTTMTLDGDKLVQTQKGDPPSVLTREIVDGKLLLTMECKGVVAKRYYKKKE